MQKNDTKVSRRLMASSPLARDITAENLLQIGAVNFLDEDPIRLKSGLVTPIYVDNRKLISHPDEWHDVIETMASFVEELKLEFDFIAGVESAGVSHAAALAYRMNRGRLHQGQESPPDRRPHLDRPLLPRRDRSDPRGGRHHHRVPLDHELRYAGNRAALR